ncbi:hypothetical protein HMPREF9145_0501 [Segatella salivae F0493]|uniref:Uncharacterized protein n=1 Tax=Segatella salivae F0493 TaxID=1395125 RepID=U2LD38_9BACT|nr:hypothetical protein HMPREF9145_0501 [Segatella salivae F0493]
MPIGTQQTMEIIAKSSTLSVVSAHKRPVFSPFFREDCCE